VALTLAQILDREYARAKQPKGPTLGSLAEHLGVRQDQLSRLRTGSLRLSARLADRIAAVFEPRDPARASALRTELLAARSQGPERSSDSRPDLVVALRKLFGNLAERRGLLCVCYRDFPQGLGEFSETATIAGEAVARGMTFALFQPFGSLEVLERESVKRGTREPLAVRDYRRLLADGVRSVFEKMRSNARKAAAKAAPGQMALYEPATLHPTPCGFATRLFYTAYLQHDQGLREQLYEWVAGTQPEEHRFVERGDPQLVKAVAGQFHPINTWWKEKGTLPVTNGQLEEAFSLFRLELGGELPKKRTWNVAGSLP